MTDIASQAGTPPPPDNLDYLRFHALKTPGRPMLRHTGGGAVTYAGLYRGVLQVAAALRDLGVRHGELVAVGHVDPCVQLLLLLGCESLGAATVSFRREEWLGLESMFSQVDRVLSQEHIDGAAGPLHCLDAAWFEAAHAAPPVRHDDLPAPARTSDDPMRLLRSSGTTAEPKLIMMTRGRLEYTIRRLVESRGFTARSVELLAMPFTVNGAYVRACLCMRLGATVVVGEPMRALRDFGVTHMAMLPLDVRRLLDQLPKDWRKPDRHIGMSAIGGPMPETLRRQALEKLCTEVVNAYGTNEAGGIAELDVHGRGILLPGVQVRIVDDDGAELPPGSEGHVAVRGPCMITGYWRSPEATARFFRGGWFHPGDRARMPGPRRIELLGRSDDMLNVGGIKRSPEVIEEAFLAHPLVRDAAATAVPGTDGIEVLCVAVVLAEPGRLREVGRETGAGLPAWTAGMRMVECPVIPRTPNGKIRRAELRHRLSQPAREGGA